MAGGGAATAYDPLDVTQYTLDELKAAVEAADDWNTYVTVHAYTRESVRRAVEAGVKCIEHGQLLDEATDQAARRQGHVAEPAGAGPGAADGAGQRPREEARGHPRHRQRLQVGQAAQGQARCGAPTSCSLPAQNKNQNTDILKLKQWFTPAEALKLVTHDNAQVLALSGPRNPYPGKLGVVEPGALADLLLVDGDPLANLDLIADPARTSW